MQWSELFLLYVVDFMIKEMECKRTIYTIESAWKSD